MSSDSYPYAEPSLPHLLTLSSFFILVNLFRALVDFTIRGAGLLGEISVGIAFGTPLAGILPDEWMETMEVLGYVGLCLMVLEGGLNTPLAHALPSLHLSLLVAATGIITPIISSLIYFHLVLRPRYSLLHAFAAGAALSSTSLGTTFTVISSAGGDAGLDIGKGKLGAVLISAAMADDIIGLILLKMIVALGQQGGADSIVWTIFRPIIASGGVLLVSWPIARWAFRPAISLLVNRMPEGRRHEVNLAVIVLLGTGYIAIASLAGTSPLLGAFVAGLVLASVSSYLPITSPDRGPSPSISQTFDLYVGPILTYVFRPIFFASIGFAIPVKRMFRGAVVWKGLVYTVLMVGAKAICGIWVPIADGVGVSRRRQGQAKKQTEKKEEVADANKTEDATSSDRPAYNARISKLPLPLTTDEGTPTPPSPPVPPSSLQSPPPPVQKPSLFLPTSLLGFAMVARGEIGLLIAQVANTTGLLEDDLFMICTWAIVLCTVVGPVGAGWVCKRWVKVGAGESLGRWVGAGT